MFCHSFYTFSIENWCNSDDRLFTTTPTGANIPPNSVARCLSVAYNVNIPIKTPQRIFCWSNDGPLPVSEIHIVWIGLTSKLYYWARWFSNNTLDVYVCLNWNTSHPEVLHGFPQSLQANERTGPWSGPERFRLNPFQFIIHYSSQNVMLYWQHCKINHMKEKHYDLSNYKN
jgi:hypothetical protein